MNQNQFKLLELFREIYTLHWLYKWRDPSKPEEIFLQEVQKENDKNNAVLDKIRILLDESKMNLDFKDHRNYGVFKNAVTQDNVDLVKMLFEYNAPYNYEETDTALHRAAEFGCINVIKYLVEEKKISPQKKSSTGYSVLTAARNSKHSKDVVSYLIKWLLESGYQKAEPPKKLKALSETDILKFLPNIDLAPNLKQKLTEIIESIFVEEFSVSIQEFYETIQEQEPDIVFACIDLISKASTNPTKDKTAKKIPSPFYAHHGNLEITAKCKVNSLLVTGNLTIQGNIENVEGCQIFLGGNLTCENMYTEGPVIIGGNLVAEEIKAYYNDYNLQVKGKIIAEKLIIDNHEVIGDVSKVKNIQKK